LLSRLVYICGTLRAVSWWPHKRRICVRRNDSAPWHATRPRCWR